MRLLRSPREEAGDQHRRQGEDAGSLQVYDHLCLLWEEDECYHKQRLSAKLKGEHPGKGSGKGGGKGNGNNSGKGKSKGHGKGKDKNQG